MSDRHITVVGRRTALWLVSTTVGQCRDADDDAAMRLLAQRYGCSTEQFVITTMTTTKKGTNQ